MPNNLVKFIYVPGAVTADQIAAFDANTIYFVAGTGGADPKIYKGSTIYANAGDLATLRTQIGTLPVDQGYTDLIDYIDKQIAAGDTANSAEVAALDAELADVAKSGAAEDVSIADSGSLITATNVEDALAELATSIANTDAAAEVTIESASGSGDVLTTYDFYQGVLGTDDAAAKAAKKIGTINIPKDYLVRSATIETVETADEPYTGAAVGDKYIDFVVNTKDGDTGTPQHMYIALNDLVAVMQGSTGEEITVTIGANNTIQATVNEVHGSKVIYQVGTGGAADVTVNDKIAELEEAMGDGFEALDADVDAVTDPAVTDAEKVAVITGVTEVDGIITSVDSVDVDRAGAASRAKAAVIGQNGDATTDNTIYGAKAYADAADIVVKSDLVGTNADIASANTIYGAKAYADDAVSEALTWGSLS